MVMFSLDNFYYIILLIFHSVQQSVIWMDEDTYRNIKCMNEQYQMVKMMDEGCKDANAEGITVQS